MRTEPLANREDVVLIALLSTVLHADCVCVSVSVRACVPDAFAKLTRASGTAGVLTDRHSTR